MHGFGSGTPRRHATGLTDQSGTHILNYLRNDSHDASQFGPAMAWCNYPIRLHICPPTSIQFRKCVAGRGRCPSGAEAQMLGEEVMSWSPPH